MSDEMRVPLAHYELACNEREELETRLSQTEAERDLAVKALEWIGGHGMGGCAECCELIQRARGILTSLPEARDRVRDGEPQDGDYFLVGRERWKIDRPEPHNPIAFTTPRDPVPVFRVNAERLLSAGVTVLKGDAAMQFSEEVAEKVRSGNE